MLIVEFAIVFLNCSYIYIVVEGDGKVTNWWDWDQGKEKHQFTAVNYELQTKKSDALFLHIAFFCVNSSGLEFYVDDFTFLDFCRGAIFCNRARSAIGGGAVLPVRRRMALMRSIISLEEKGFTT